MEDSDAEWAQEKGAIEQEVARDLSEPTYKFITRLNEDLFSGTPYEHDALGTRESFEATTGGMLKRFHNDWYAPNNAILIVTGNVDRPGGLLLAQHLARATYLEVVHGEIEPGAELLHELYRL